MSAVFCDQCGAKLAYNMCPKCPGQKRPVRIIPLNEHSFDDKMKLFDKLYGMCLDHAKNVFEKGRCACECDCDVYLFEEVLRACLGKEIFTFLNNAGEYTWSETP